MSHDRTLSENIRALDHDSANSALLLVSRRLHRGAPVRSAEPDLMAAVSGLAEATGPSTIAEEATIAHLALLLAADDLLQASRVVDAVADVRERPGRAFAPPDPITLAAVITAALTVLGTHVEYEREGKRWSVKVVKKPTDSRVLDALIRAICRATESFLSKRDDEQGP